MATLKDNTPVVASNLESILTQLGMYSMHGQLMHPKFGDVSSNANFATVCWQIAALGGTVNGGGAQSFSVNTMRMVPFFVPKTIHIDNIAFIVSIVGAAGSKARIGLYNSNQTSPFLPTSLIVDGGEFDTTILNAKITPVDVVLQGGTIYWAAYLCGTAAPTILAQQTVFADPFLGYQIAAGSPAAAATSGIVLAQNYGALPANCPTDFSQYNINGTGPGIFYRIN